MQNIKKNFTYVVVGALVMALFISCKNDDKTGSGNGGNVEADTGGGTRTLSYYAGDWWGNPGGGEQHMFTINADGSVTIKIQHDGSETTYPSTDITKNSDTSYTYYDATEDAGMYFNFTSDTKGTVSMDGSPAINVTKK